MKDIEIECLKAEITWIKETLAVSVELNKKYKKDNVELRKTINMLLANRKVDNLNIWVYCLISSLFTALAIYGIIL